MMLMSVYSDRCSCCSTSMACYVKDSLEGKGCYASCGKCEGDTFEVFSEPHDKKNLSEVTIEVCEVHAVCIGCTCRHSKHTIALRASKLLKCEALMCDSCRIKELHTAQTRGISPAKIFAMTVRLSRPIRLLHGDLSALS